MSVKAIIPTAGRGKRIGEEIPKQYLILAGLPIIVYTLIKFQESELVEEVVLVVGRGEVNWVKANVISGRDLTKVKTIIEGGRERQDSVASGLNQIWDNTDENDIIVVHDGVRPFVYPKDIDNCICEARKSGACIMGIQIKETLKVVSDNDMIIEGTVSNKGIWVAQTPQAFRAGLLKKAYECAQREGFYGSDEASLVERISYPISVVQGSFWNIKITYPEDLNIAEKILSMRASL